MCALPAHDEYEITVFGAGSGECSVIHIGDGNWIVIDSVMDHGPRGNVTAAQRYLSELGVDITKQVRLVLATHWHEDHIKGISSLFVACKEANFALPSVSSVTTLNQILGSALSSPTAGSTAVKELCEVFREIRIRQDDKKPCERQFCQTGIELHFETSDKHKVDVLVLAPSNETVAKSQAWVVNKCILSGQVTKVVVPESNDPSVAIWMRLPNEGLVFAADVENCAQANEGWNHIVATYSKTLNGAKFIKIPHHGSANAHSPEFWARMLAADPIGILTSYDKGTNPPPTKSDIKRLKEGCEKLFMAGSNKAVGPKFHTVATAHLAATGVKLTRAGYYVNGRVTLRKKAGVAEWSATTDGRASLMN